MADYNLKAVITGDASGYEAAVSKAKKASDTLSSSIGQISKLMTTAFSVVGISASISSITKFGNECVKSAESANKSLSILNNTLKVTGATAWTTSDDLVKMSEDIAYSTNYTVGEIQDMQSVLLGFKNITGDTFRDASDAITDMATVMGMDLKSAVQTVGKALDDPIKGLDSLKRQGFAFTEEQKEQMKVLVESGKIIEAQKLILDELNTTYGGAAIAAQSSFDKQKDAITKFKETLGNQLLPVLDTFSEKSANAFDDLTDKIQTVDFTSIAADIEYSVQLIKEYLKVFYENIKELFRGITEQLDGATFNVETFKQNIYNVLNTIYKQMQLSFGFMKSLINGDWKLAWEYAKLFVLEASKKIVDELNNLMKKMPDIVNGAIKGLNAYYEAQDKVLIEWLHLPEKWVKAPRLGTYDGENFIDTSKLQSQIDEATRIIEDATGKQVTINLTGLEQIDENRKKYSKKAESEEIRLTSTTTTQVEKRETVTVKFFKTLREQFEAYIKKTQKDAEDWSNTFDNMFGSVKEMLQNMFMQLGEDLVDGEASWQSYASVAVDAIAEVLKSLSAQLTAIAVARIANYDYASAAIAMAGATAALVASGSLKAVAKSLSTVAEKAKTATVSISDFRKALDDIRTGISASPASLLNKINAYKKQVNNITKAIKEVKAEWRSAIKERDRLEAIERPLWDYYYTHTNNQVAYKRALDANKASAKANDVVNQLSRKESELYNLQKEAQESIKKASEESYKALKDQNDSVVEMTESYNMLYKAVQNYLLSTQEVSDDVKTFYKIIVEEQKTNISNMVSDLYSTLTTTGQSIGEKLTQSIVDGATYKDFETELRNYIRENLIKVAIYTESFQDKLAKIGAKLSGALIGNYVGIAPADKLFQKIQLAEVKNQIKGLYEESIENAKQAEDIISWLFGDLSENVEEALEETEKHLSRFEQAMESFKDTVSDLGGDIASNFVDAISNGLNQSDFLDSMKKWIKKMLVQSVVYTESMKAEIEAIGQAITKGLSEGFTETTFHEIRRDLSWVFDQANQTISGIDNILNNVFGGYATGTQNATGGLHLVGEAGPELVRFSGGERVYNANDTKNMLSGVKGGNTFNVTFNNTQDTTAFAMMQQLRSYNRELAFNGIL